MRKLQSEDQQKNGGHHTRSPPALLAKTGRCHLRNALFQGAKNALYASFMTKNFNFKSKT
jgi:hypothetical protein